MMVSNASVSPVCVCHLYIEGSGAGDHFKQVVPHHQLTAETEQSSRNVQMCWDDSAAHNHLPAATLTSVCTPALCESPSAGWLSAPPSPTRKARGENKRRFTSSGTCVETDMTLRKPSDSYLCYVCRMFPDVIWILTLSETGKIQNIQSQSNI